MNNKSKFNFDEIVKIISSYYEEKEIIGLEGYIAGIAKDEDGTHSYGVFIFDKKEVWRFAEHQITSTGKYYIEGEPIETIKVSVDKDGNGDLIE